jgi:hypothetical protein
MRLCIMLVCENVQMYSRDLDLHVFMKPDEYFMELALVHRFSNVFYIGLLNKIYKKITVVRKWSNKITY